MLQSAIVLMLCNAAKFTVGLSDMIVNRKIVTGNLRSVRMLYEKVFLCTVEAG